MEKVLKIMLSCVCAVFLIAMMGLGIWKMTGASPAVDNSQHNRIDASDGAADSVKITLQDGSEWTVGNPSMLGDYNADNVQFWFDGS